MIVTENFPPSDDLTPYIRRLYVFEGQMPEGFVIADDILSENAFVRVLLKGNWMGQTNPGEMGSVGRVLLFGGNAHPFPVRLEGSFKVAAFGIRPSAWRALFKSPATDFVDRMVDLRDEWGDIADQMFADLESAADAETMVAAMEKAVRAQIKAVGRHKIDDKVARFEHMARTECALKIEHAAERMGLSIGQAERRVRACYGLTPKAVMRRSRFMELAAAMRGMDAPDAQQLAMLKYFDQSHINREFRQFAGRNPSAFKTAFTPLFDMGLKMRIQGKEIE